MPTTRDRLLAEGMRLFGQQGYAATTVAQIEAAAGLSPGSGSLYKHFRSKEELLGAGVALLLQTEDAVAQASAPQVPVDPHSRIRALVWAGLDRMEQDRDINRLLFRGLDSFPDLLRQFGTQEVARVHEAISELLSEMAGPSGRSTDWPAVAVVLQGATAHYWALTDLFSEHPTGIDHERFVQAIANLAAAMVGSLSNDPSPTPT